MSLCTGCAVGNRFLVAWSDMREGYARIYYHYSDDQGASWAPSSGQPLWPSLSTSSAVQQFHPQMTTDDKGVAAFTANDRIAAAYRARALGPIIPAGWSQDPDSGP